VSDVVTVAIPVRDGGAMLEQTLAAVTAQRLAPGLSLELIVCDSGSRDDSVPHARSYGARVIEIPAESFSHGGTRNLLMERSRGAHVAFLTQDAVPADEYWLSKLVGGFALAADVGLVFGPYRPRADASPMVRRELTDWFRHLSPDGLPAIHRLDAHERDIPRVELRGPRGFFTDANGCVARVAWERAPFREVAYAEDHLLAHDMMRAGFAKVYLPEAGVIHSHEYSPAQWMRRSFDEARAVREVYDWVAAPRVVAWNLRGNVMADWRWVRRTTSPSASGQVSVLARSLPHHGARSAGELLGGRADRLPSVLAAWLSLEGRS
jgi:rhamnosyltransferase